MSEHYEESEEPRNDDFGFEWQNGDDELSPDVQKLLEELSVPIGRVPVRKLGEIVCEDCINEVRVRLEELRVEGYDRVNKKWLDEFPELHMTPNILDDVHYKVYRNKKNLGPYNRYVSVSAEDVFDEFENMKETGTNGILLQREQDTQAKKTLIKNHIEENSVYEAMITAEGRFAVRSLFRLLREESMRAFTNAMIRATRRRMDEAPLSFDEVAAHAPGFIEKKLGLHTNYDPSHLSTDQRLTHELISRDLYRARAFAKPIIEYMTAKTSSDTPGYNE